MANRPNPKYSIGIVDGPNECGVYTAAVDFDGDDKRPPHGAIVETYDSDKNRAIRRAEAICNKLNHLTIQNIDI